MLSEGEIVKKLCKRISLSGGGGGGVGGKTRIENRNGRDNEEDLEGDMITFPYSKRLRNQLARN